MFGNLYTGGAYYVTYISKLYRCKLKTCAVVFRWAVPVFSFFLLLQFFFFPLLQFFNFTHFYSSEQTHFITDTFILNCCVARPDEIDAAARILDPVFTEFPSASRGEADADADDGTKHTRSKHTTPQFGKFFKDFNESEW